MQKARRTQAERHQESEQKLIQAAIEMVADRGYDQLRLADLGEAAGFSRGLAAHYFGNRESLMRRVVVEILARTSRSLSESDNPSDDPLEAIFRRLRAAVQRWTRAPTDGKALFAVIAAGVTNEDLAVDIRNHNLTVLGWFSGKFREAIDAGLVPANIDPDAEARLYFSIIRGAGTTDLVQPGWEAEVIIERFIASATSSYAAGVGR
ncbi:TetR/AcrR family transcriptional regulator [Bosea sp. F3-2]|uniref:TetR/AcrR family transcriptional regulator n=1 Tax=Bosea sp. F3-2 TaxID=2599640 RepID=UPI0011EBFE68|nr:TetR/AcrR family transcriptional regulator [Bosea sp. F3-2]QEL22872.1 TetR/AcrR family transcriptional regulator [Bosea sp. F3-2]